MSQPRISLSMVLHNHQPVGNFGWVFEDHYRTAYAPMLEALQRHPGVRVGLHYTGPLLEWLRHERPEAIERIRDLVAREQVEVLGGGQYEPVLASLPGHDRLGQLERMADEVEALFGRRPRGAWLAERVWEPDLPMALADAGYEYTVLDDTHLRAAAVPDERHWGIHTTDDQGRRLLVFGTEQGLRYLIPFRPVEQVIEHLRAHATEAGDRVGMMGDDGEKFGGWPTTWELCWGAEAWVERFFAALDEHAGWLDSVRPSDALDAHQPIGRVYIPTGSYAEMGEWSLPVDARREFSRTLHAAQAEGRPEARWMRGGFWRAFQVNYSEVGDLHKQMLRTSAAVAAAMAQSDDLERDAAITDHLYRGQSNDCYWHGLFGGIYLSHMRLATAGHLIAAEDAADRLTGRTSDGQATIIEQTDTDLDGHLEIVARTAGQVVVLKPDLGGSLTEWDVRAARHALASVMRRRPEAYHDTLVAFESGGAGAGGHKGVSIDDDVRVTEEGLSRRLWYDDHDRGSTLVRFLASDVTLDELERATAEERGDFLDAAFEVVETGDGRVVLERRGAVRDDAGHEIPVRVRKTIGLRGDRREPGLALAVEIANEGRQRIDARLALEWSLNMLGGGGDPQAWIEAGGERHRFDSKGRLSDSTGRSGEVAELTMGNDGVGITLRSRASGDADAWWYSIETISLSEAGFERNHQGSCLLWTWPLALEPGRSASFEVDQRVPCSVDRAEDEGL